jgi:predicted nucleic acid-binding protein
MSGNKLFLDTNIIIYFLSGDTSLANLLEKKSIHISIITKLELLSYPDISNTETIKIEKFLDDCIIVDLNPSIHTQVIRLRKKYRLKLPDSIVIASATFLDLPLITSDKDFQKVKEVNLLYYQKH